MDAAGLLGRGSREGCLTCVAEGGEGDAEFQGPALSSSQAIFSYVSAPSQDELRTNFSHGYLGA